MTKRLPTEAELLINERIMGGCNHPSHTTETKRERGYDYQYLICTICGQRYSDTGSDEYLMPWEEETKKPEDYLKKFVPLYCENIIMARTVVRHLETKGWKPFMRTESEGYRYSFSKGAAAVDGGLENSEHAAICSAAEKLARQAP